MGRLDPILIDRLEALETKSSFEGLTDAETKELDNLLSLANLAEEDPPPGTDSRL